MKTFPTLSSCKTPLDLRDWTSFRRKILGEISLRFFSIYDSVRKIKISHHTSAAPFHITCYWANLFIGQFKRNFAFRRENI